MLAFSEKRFFEWHEDTLSVSLRAKSGSYGGGSEVLIVFEDEEDESNEVHGGREPPKRQPSEGV